MIITINYIFICLARIRIHRLYVNNYAKSVIFNHIRMPRFQKQGIRVMIKVAGFERKRRT